MNAPHRIPEAETRRQLIERADKALTRGHMGWFIDDDEIDRRRALSDARAYAAEHKPEIDAEWEAQPDGRAHVEQRRFADANRARIDADWECG